MSTEDKFNSLKSYILSHLGDQFNNLYNFNINDKSIICKLDAIYNESPSIEPKIIFRDLNNDSLIELKPSNMPKFMKSINHNEDIF